MKHYPVRRRGQERHLNPNQDGIDWLEGEAFKSETEIVEAYTTSSGTHWECTVQRVYGWFRASGHGHPRPMFQTFTGGASSGMSQTVTPCEACDNFAVSWSCADHPEAEWDGRAFQLDNRFTPSTDTSSLVPSFPSFREWMRVFSDNQPVRLATITIELEDPDGSS